MCSVYQTRDYGRSQSIPLLNMHSLIFFVLEKKLLSFWARVNNSFSPFWFGSWNIFKTKNLKLL